MGNTFPGAPNRVNDLLNDPRFQAANKEEVSRSGSMIRMNGLFVDLLRSLGGAFEQRPLEAKLARITDAGIVSTDRGFVLREFENVKTNATRESFPDKTGYECFHQSHPH